MDINSVLHLVSSAFSGSFSDLVMTNLNEKQVEIVLKINHKVSTYTWIPETSYLGDVYSGQCVFILL